MSILNVDKIQPIGGGSTITVDATDIQASTGTIRASTFSGDVSATGIGVTSLNVTGVSTVSGGELILNRQGNLNYIEIGKGQNSNQYAYIDLIGDTTYSDFGFRIIRENTGANAETKLQHRGTGDFVISSADSSSLSFETNGGEKLRITSAGNLQAAGITTSNTGFMFGTGGQHYLYQSASDTATLRITSDGPYVQFKDVSGDVQMGSASGTLRLSAGGSEKVRITSAGKVGIGTDNPTNKFEVYGTDAAVTLLNYGQSSGGLAAWTSGRLAFVSAHQNDDLVFGYSNSTLSVGNFVERMRIDNGTGYVNIGTGSAEQQLTVQNSAQHSLIRVIGNASSDTGVDFGDPADSDIGRIRYSNNGDYMTFRVNNINSVRFDNSGRVQIGGGDTPAQVGDGRLIVYSTDRLHPAIKCAGMSNNYANGWSLLGDNYQTDESQINLGLSYSSSSLVLSRCVKVSGSADNTYLSSQDSFSTRPSALVLGSSGELRYHTTETNATTATDSAVSLTEVFQIDRVGNIYQKTSARSMYFGSTGALRIGVQSNGDSNIEAVSGDMKFMDSGSTIMQLRSDGLEMKQDIYFGTAGKGICLGTTSNTDSQTLDDYEEGTWTPAAYGFTISTQYSARYTKVGRLVHINCYVQASTGSGTSLQPQISGLPFTSVASNSYSYGAGRIGTGGFNNSSVDIAFQQQSSTNIVKFYVGGGGINESMMSGQHVIFSMVYEAA